MKRWLLCLLVAAALLKADTLLVPNLTVLGTNSADGVGFDNGGPTFTVNGNFLGTDTLSLIVSGRPGGRRLHGQCRRHHHRSQHY
jgi:hypothetical protein